MRDWTPVDQKKADKASAKLPKRLCKYVALDGARLDYARQVIVESKLWATAPGNFNDPLDCRIPPVFHKADEETVRQYWRNHVKDTKPNEDLANHQNTIEDIVRDSAKSENREAFAELVDRIIQSNGIICLTPDPKSMLMWSYYSAGHSGVCFIFHTLPAFITALADQVYPLEVKYQKCFPLVDFYRSGTFDFTQAVVGTKSHVWKHESEWRLVFPGGTGHISFPPEMLIGIVFGLKTSLENQAQIRVWNDQREHPVQLFEVCHLRDSFSLEVFSRK